MTAREELLAWIVFVLLYPLALLMLSGPRLFDRPFWADEVLSWLIASDPDYSHSMAALAGGVDTNAPILHWVYRIAGNAFGHTPLTYRLLSTLAMSVGMVGVYACLRRFATRVPSAAGTLSLLGLPIILAHTTEARFYGFFLAGAVWAAHFLDRRLERPSVSNAALVGITSSYLCGVHYFGVLALGCLALFAAVRALPRGLYRSADILWPTAAGLVMTLCLLPLLKTQREALAGAGGTWVPDLFMQNLATTVSMLMPVAPACVMGLILLLALVSLRRKGGTELSIPPTSAAGLVLLPMVLLCFDRVVQPVLVPRYFIAALPIVAVLICTSVGAMPTRFRFASLTALAILFAGGASNLRWKLAHPDPRTGMGVLAQVPRDDSIIAVDWRGHLLPIWADRPGQRDRIVFFDDPRVSHPELDQSIPFEREMVRIMNRFYGFPRTISVSELAKLDRFRLVTEFPETAEQRLGSVRVIARTPLSLLVERVSTTAKAR